MFKSQKNINNKNKKINKNKNPQWRHTIKEKLNRFKFSNIRKKMEKLILSNGKNKVLTKRRSMSQTPT